MEDKFTKWEQYLYDLKIDISDDLNFIKIYPMVSCFDFNSIMEEDNHPLGISYSASVLVRCGKGNVHFAKSINNQSELGSVEIAENLMAAVKVDIIDYLKECIGSAMGTSTSEYNNFLTQS